MLFYVLMICIIGILYNHLWPHATLLHVEHESQVLQNKGKIVKQKVIFLKALIFIQEKWIFIKL